MAKRKKKKRVNETSAPDELTWPGGLDSATTPSTFFERQLAMIGQKVRIYTETRQKRHVVTIVEGLDPKVIDFKSLTSELKRLCAAGGTYKKYKDKLVIILQGDHVEKVRRYLIENLGIPEENIETI